MIIYGIGYERRDPDQLLQRLTSAQVDLLVDVRLNPVSRKKGFSKRRLAELLDEHGIGYLHLRDLGNEKENRAGFSQINGHAATSARNAYRAHLTNGSTPAVHELLRLTDNATVALLCFERDEQYCHRQVLMEYLQNFKPELVTSSL